MLSRRAQATARLVRCVERLPSSTGRIQSEVLVTRAWNLAFWKEGEPPDAKRPAMRRRR
jgi:hypothetical protein